jgi:hypothetical protein
MVQPAKLELKRTVFPDTGLLFEFRNATVAVTVVCPSAGTELAVTVSVERLALTLGTATEVENVKSLPSPVPPLLVATIRKW